MLYHVKNTGIRCFVYSSDVVLIVSLFVGNKKAIDNSSLNGVKNVSRTTYFGRSSNNYFNLTIPVVMKIACRFARQFSRQALRAGIAG
jgi:uncharacterized protein (UPF0128 family)